MKVFKKTFQYGEHEVTLEIGGIARQASGSVMVRIKDTAVLVTAVTKKEARPDASFFALTVNYQEKMYASGSIPGGYLKREGRPGDHETLIARLIDRPIRPLFPKGFMNEIQIVATVMSSDPTVSPDIPAMIGASAALTLSGAPFMGPIGAARVSYKDGEYFLNPSKEAVADMDLDLVVAGTEDAVLMVESEAKQLPEDVMLGAVLYGHEQMQVVIKAIKELDEVGGKEKWQWQAPEHDAALVKQVTELSQEKLTAAYQIKEKAERYEAIGELKTHLVESLVTEAEDSPAQDDVMAIFSDLEHDHVRQTILRGELRIDGRDTRTVRPINIQHRVLPRAHGSALFTRGETQAIVVATLGSERDAQNIDAMEGASKDRFMLHYNFPPYCVGETGMMGSPKRREIGHGNLAKRALKAVVPSMEEFPYALRVVSEITESNGSSSMASVCGGSLALMDAGVPLKAPVAGVAMGLIKEGDKFAVLTDILGDEDHLGDMDFKVAGSEHGVTALQMDIKIAGITKEIMSAALSQAKEGRMHILGLMKQVVDKPQEMSDFAPRIYEMKIKADKIRDVIGKGGATIKSITEEFGVTMDIDDSGLIQIFASERAAAEGAIKRVEGIVEEAKIGQIYEGVVSRIADFGAFVTILPGKDGLVHVSQIAEERVENVTDYLQEGQQLKVKVLDIDRQGRVKLTMRDLDASAEAPAEKSEASSDAEQKPAVEAEEPAAEDKPKEEKKPRTRKPAAKKPAAKKAPAKDKQPKAEAAQDDAGDA